MFRGDLRIEAVTNFEKVGKNCMSALRIVLFVLAIRIMMFLGK
jgi:hypothetical protein